MKKNTVLSISLGAVLALGATAYVCADCDQENKVAPPAQVAVVDQEKIALSVDSFQVQDNFVSQRDNMKWYFYVSSPQISVDSKVLRAYPGLKSALDKINADSAKEASRWKALFAEELPQLRADNPNDFESPEHFYNYYDTTLGMVRADNQVVSLLEGYRAYRGGAHGDYAVTAHNFDPATGKNIELSSLCSDLGAVRNFVLKQLSIEYPNASFIDHEATLQKLFAPENSAELGGKWTMTKRGIEFRFNPYELACYADGMLMIYIDAHDHPELFKKEAISKYFSSSSREHGDKNITPLRPKQYRELLGKWRLTKMEVEDDVTDAQVNGIDFTLTVDQEGFAHCHYKYDDNCYDDEYMPVKFENKALYDGCAQGDWCATLVNSNYQREYMVTVLPDGTLRMLKFGYYNGMEGYPSVMMGIFVREESGKK